jgi:hypothetical protein
MKRIYVPLTIILLIFIGSCYYDSEESLYPALNSGCDTSNVTFSGTIVPILKNNCLSCHSNANAPAFGNNIPLQNYADVSAKAAKIAGSIKHLSGFAQMPNPGTGSKIKDCYITQFDIWVRLEKLNN